MWLGDNEVVTVWEDLKCVLQEVLRSTVESGFHAKQSDGEGILGGLRRIGNRCQVVDFLTLLLDERVIAVLHVVRNRRQFNQSDYVWTLRPTESEVFRVVVLELDNSELTHSSIVLCHLFHCLQQVVQTS
jgi:hypothetical protein